MKNLNKKTGFVNFEHKKNLLTFMEKSFVRSTAQDLARLKNEIRMDRELRKLQNIHELTIAIDTLQNLVWMINEDFTLNNTWKKYLEYIWRYIDQNSRSKFPATYALRNADLVFKCINEKLNAVAHNENIFADLGI